MISRGIQGTMGEVSAAIQEVVDASREVKMFGSQELEAESFERINQRNRDFNLKETAAAEIDTIAFDRVGLTYEPGKPSALKGVDLTISSGEHVAFVGESGSGKTSLVNLLPRLYEVDEGAVRINGQSISEYSLQSLRSRIAYVSQDVTLFNDSIAANIAYGSRESVSRERLEAACRAAHAHDFIESLTDGYDTVVGEDGTMLSRASARCSMGLRR